MTSRGMSFDTLPQLRWISCRNPLGLRNRYVRYSCVDPIHHHTGSALTGPRLCGAFSLVRSGNGSLRQFYTGLSGTGCVASKTSRFITSTPTRLLVSG